MKIFTTAIILSALVTPLTAQWAQYHTPGIPRTADGKPNLAAPAPRTADGKPDLTGLWGLSNNYVADLKPGELQPWVQALVQRRSEDFNKDDPRYQCLPDGPGYSTRGGMQRIVQTPAMIVILNEDLTYRQIFMDGRALETDPSPSWMGYSVGHWDGDTLVVESSGFNDRTWLDGRGHSHTEALRMTERYRRANFGRLDIEVTFQDPAAYSRPWTIRGGAQLAADTELLIAVCNEGSGGQEHWIGKASDAEKSAVKLAPEILAKYTGVYKGVWQRQPRTVEMTFSGGTLFVAVNGGEKRPLIPQSETKFAGTGLSYDFIRDERGAATHVIEGHVSGDYKFERQK
jgi:hypothetical protein